MGICITIELNCTATYIQPFNNDHTMTFVGVGVVAGVVVVVGVSVGVVVVVVLLVVGCLLLVVGCCFFLLLLLVVMCHGQNMELFPIKGNGHPIIDSDFCTHCSHHTSSWRIGAPNIFHTVPLLDSGTLDFLA